MRILLGLVMSIALTACDQSMKASHGAGQTGLIAVSDQQSGPEILIEEAALDYDGWIVVHAIRNGQPDYASSIGHLYIPAGTSKELSVPLAQPANAGDEVIVMLHEDTGSARVFEYASAQGSPEDGPVLVNGRHVQKRIVLN